jgi:hypothetical protein
VIQPITSAIPFPRKVTTGLTGKPGSTVILIRRNYGDIQLAEENLLSKYNLLYTISSDWVLPSPPGLCISKMP